MTRSLFEGLELAPRDPILGLTEAFNADTRPNKVNLGVGVYTDENGKIPLLASVREAEAARVAALPPRGYLPIDGIAGYNQGAQALLFGADSAIVKEGRVVTVQALGGTGALKLGADFLRHFVPESDVWISDPSWENHRALFEMAGFKVHNYPYYDAKTHGVKFAEMLDTLKNLPPRSIVVLHSCCHNPTGVDLTPAQWKEAIEVLVARDAIPFLDLAYQGFNQG
ncbi:MAG: aminotransferase class I/II-fold pyridoxal phosphate-dependent enzyme, partial [Burkholderiaceae bacterium]